MSSGNASITFSSLTLNSGNGNATLASLTLNPTAGAFVSLGSATASNNTPKSLILDGNSTGNIITGAVSDGTNAALSLTKSNASTWTLSGTNSYSGATTINGGTLRINGTSSGAGAVTVSSNATLGGNGTIGSGTLGTPSSGNGTITVSGNITAGPNSTISGTLTSLSSNGVTFNGGSGYLWKINNGTGTAGSSSGWDLVATNGLTFSSLSSVSQFTVSVSGSPTNLQAGNTTYVIATDPVGPIAVNSIGTQPNGTILIGAGAATADSNLFALNTSGFSSSSTPGVSSSTFQLELVGDGSSGQDLALLVYNATPEPGTTILVLGGVVPMLSRRRQRRSANEKGTA